jgi:PASTA domain
MRVPTILIAAIIAIAPAGCGGGDESTTSGLTGAALAQLNAAAQTQRAEQQRVSEVRVTVPAITGEPYGPARRQIDRAGLIFSGRYPGTEGNPDLPTRCLIVDSQSPAAGTEVAKGSIVVGTIGVCPEKIPGLSRRSPYGP